MGDVEATAAGQDFRGYRRGAVSGDPVDQYVVPVLDRIVTYKGRSCSFRQLGIAGTAGQKLGSIFNAAGSSVLCDVELIAVDVMQTAARVVEPPVIRAHKITTAPTGGTAMTKIATDSTMSTSSSIALLQGTASEGGSATAIVSTPAANTIINQEWAPRALTLVGYEQFDRVEWFNEYSWTLRAGEGILVNLDYTAATANPVTDKWVIMFVWSEYTRP